MVSFISVFRRWCYFILAGIAFLVAVSMSYYYNEKLNPEVRFWNAAIENKFDYYSTLNEKKETYVFVGGSSCNFSINPELLNNKFGIQAINMGIHAGAGRALQLELGLQVLKPRDTLVLAMETTFWSSQNVSKQEAFGSKLYHSNKRFFQKSQQVDELGIPFERNFWDLRPGGRHLLTRSVLMAAGKESYRYREEDLRPGGFIIFDRPWPELLPSNQRVSGPLSEAAKELLKSTLRMASENQFSVLVTIPWRLVKEEHLEDYRKSVEKLVSEIEVYCPVIADRRSGALSDPSYFSDSSWHLSVKATVERNTELGAALISQKIDEAK